MGGFIKYFIVLMIVVNFDGAHSAICTEDITIEPAGSILVYESALYKHSQTLKCNSILVLLPRNTESIQVTCPIVQLCEEPSFFKNIFRKITNFFKPSTTADNCSSKNKLFIDKKEIISSFHSPMIFFKSVNMSSLYDPKAEGFSQAGFKCYVTYNMKEKSPGEDVSRTNTNVAVGLISDTIDNDFKESSKEKKFPNKSSEEKKDSKESSEKKKDSINKLLEETLENNLISNSDSVKSSESEIGDTLTNAVASRTPNSRENSVKKIFIIEVDFLSDIFSSSKKVEKIKITEKSGNLFGKPSSPPISMTISEIFDYIITKYIDKISKMEESSVPSTEKDPIINLLDNAKKSEIMTADNSELLNLPDSKPVEEPETKEIDDSKITFDIGEIQSNPGNDVYEEVILFPLEKSDIKSQETLEESNTKEVVDELEPKTYDVNYSQFEVVSAENVEEDGSKQTDAKTSSAAVKTSYISVFNVFYGIVLLVIAI